jgi:hypothetical protein
VLIDDLTVTDVFGIETNISRAESASPDPMQAWRLFALARDGAQEEPPIDSQG